MKNTMTKTMRLLAASAAAALTTASAIAADVVQLMWTQSDGNCYAYVTDQGTVRVTANWIAVNASGVGVGTSVNGTTYVPQIKNGVITVYCSNPNVSLPTIENAGTELFGLTVTPDGRWLYVLGFSALYRYDLQDGNEGTWTVIDSDVNYVPRAIVADEAGNIYYTLRNKSVIRCRDAATGELRWSYAVSSSYNGPTGLCWNPKDNYLYWTNTSRYLFRMPADGDGAKLEVYTGTGDGEGGWGGGLCVVDGKFYMNYYNASNGRITRFEWPQGEEAKDFSIVCTGVSGYGMAIAPVVSSAAAHWPFLEAANSPVADNAADPAVHGLILRKSLRTGALAEPAEYGVRAGAAYFAGQKSYAIVSDSASLIPATGNFALSMAVGMKTAVAGGRLLSNCPLSATAQGGSLELLTDDQGESVCLRYVNAMGTELFVKGASGLADGAWHTVGVRRAGTSLELYCDGEPCGSATIDAADAIGTGIDWRIGAAGDESDGFLGVDAFVGEIKLFVGSVYPGNFAAINGRRIYTALPECPAAPSDAASLPSGYGKEVAHVYANDGAFGAPSMFVGADGKYYIAVGDNERPTAAGVLSATTVFVSSDKGSTWSVLGGDDGALPLGAVTFFERGNALHAFGQKDANTFGIYRYDPSSFWTLVASVDGAADGSYAMSPGAIAFADKRIIKPVVKRSAAFSAAARVSWVTFVDEGDDGILPGAVLEYGVTAESTAADSTLKELLPGHAFYCQNFMEMLSPIVQSSRTDCAIPVPAGRHYYSTVSFSWMPEQNPYGVTHNYHNATLFRTGNGMYGAAYDGVSSRIYSVSAADGKLVIQMSEKLPGWNPCGEISLPSDGVCLAPAIAIDGDDLVVAMGVRRDDGCGGMSLTEGGNYIAFRRIPDFRTAYSPERRGKYGKTVLYTGGSNPEGVSRIWQASDGLWYQDAYVARMYDDIGYSCVSPMGIAVIGKRIYLNCQNNAKIAVLDLNGNKVKTIDMPATASVAQKNWWSLLAADRTGRHIYLYCGDAGIYRFNAANGSWAAMIEYTSSDWDNPSAMAVASDGTLYTASYSGVSNYFYIRRFNADGTFSNLASYAGSSLGWSSFSGLAFGETEDRLFLAQCNGTISVFDLTSNEKSPLVKIPCASGNTVRKLGYMDGKLYTSGSSGRMFEIEATTGEINEGALGCDYATYGMFPYWRQPSGMSVIVR